MGRKILNGEITGPLTAACNYAGRSAGLRPAEERARLFQHPRRLYGGEAIGGELFSFYRSIGLNPSSFTARPEAFLYVTAHPNGAIRAEIYGRSGPAPTSRSFDRRRWRYSSSRPASSSPIKGSGKTAENADARRFCQDGRRRLFSTTTAIAHPRSRQGRGQLKDGTIFAPKYREQAEVLPEHQGSGRFRRQDGLRDRHAQHRADGGRQLGGAQQHFLWLYQKLAGNPRVYELIGQACRRGEPHRCRERAAHGGAQIRRAS